MLDIETVDGYSVNAIDPLYSKRKEDVARMRASLLACSADNLFNTKNALNNITALRIYHQVNRIIKYLEIMDRIEEKMYQSIDATLDRANVDSPGTWAVLLNMQSQLQENMIKSQKLLEPYLNPELIKALDVVVPESEEDTRPMLYDASTRDRIRIAAQSVITELKASGGE